jgi:dihydrofolate reductase
MSLDGFIAGPNGEFDWIVMDPDIDFRKTFSAFDTILMGRKTYEATREHSGGGMPGMKAFVVSTTLQQTDCAGVTVVRDPAVAVASLQKEPGKDIWLFGGGSLFRSMLDLGLVDELEVSVIPVLLGGGLPLLPPRVRRSTLELKEHKIYPNTGTVFLRYAVVK